MKLNQLYNSLHALDAYNISYKEIGQQISKFLFHVKADEPFLILAIEDQDTIVLAGQRVICLKILYKNHVGWLSAFRDNDFNFQLAE